MKLLEKGQRLKIDKDLGDSVIIGINHDLKNLPDYEIDASILMLSESNKMEKEEDFLFYNNLSSWNGSILIHEKPFKGYKQSSEVNLSSVPAYIRRIVFTLTIDKGDELNQSFGNVKNISIDFINKNTNQIIYRYQPEGFSKETAIIVAKVYFHENVWKIHASGKGFNAGLAEVIKRYASNKVKVEKDSPQPVLPEKIPELPAIKLRKYQEKIDLVKKETDRIGLSGQKAQVIAVIDISGSMMRMFEKGVVQKTFERVLPVALQFDDDGEIDVWTFGFESKNLYDNFSVDNDEDYVITYIYRNKYVLELATLYTPIIENITNKYSMAGKNSPPAYVLFFTDGDNSDKREAEEAIIKASNYGIFWKFIGLGGEKNCFSFLEKLDNLYGRKVNNADFIHFGDITKISDTELYQKLLLEFPDWLKSSKSKKIISTNQ